jgi:hypothetical protein
MNLRVSFELKNKNRPVASFERKTPTRKKIKSKLKSIEKKVSGIKRERKAE